MKKIEKNKKKLLVILIFINSTFNCFVGMCIDESRSDGKSIQIHHFTIHISRDMFSDLCDPIIFDEDVS